MQLRAERHSAIDREALGYQSHTSWFVTILAMMLFVAVFSVSMEAQVACIPPPTNRTPGLPGPPDWLGTINPPVKTGLDDPRWDGAGSLTWANGTSGDTAQFQAISSGGKLFLSWLVKLPPQSPSNANVVYVGFTQAAGAPANFAMAINLSSTTPQSDGTDYSLGAFSVDNAGVPTTLGSIPAWMNNTRVWITNSNFAVQMIVPISAAGISTGVNLGTDFKMWFEMQEALPPATPATVWDAVFPDGRGGTPVATDVTQPGFTVQYPAPSTWASFHQSTGPGDAACTLGGISITENQIGTLNVDPVSHLPAPNEILFDQVGVNTRVNTFFASPKNGMTTTIPAGGITATFRIADWGSTFDPNAPWTTIPGGQDVPSTLAINAGATASNTTINFNWTVQDIVSGEPWLTEFRGGKESDQCMLVELAGGSLSTWQGSHAYAVNATIVDPLGNLQRVTVAGTSGGLQPSFNGTSGGTTMDNTVTWTNAGPAIGPGLTFLNNSVLTNMTFKGASEVRQKAAINIQGLAPLSPAPRDVYLFVQTVNMPSVPETVWKNVFNRLFGPPASRNGEKSGAVLRQMSAAQINETVPSYRVFVFHDSGKKVKVGSQEFLIVHPQSGFGYYVIPHADVTGWAHSLQGANEIAPDFYRIAIPNNGIGHVVTIVNALEGVPPINVNGKFAVFADLGVAIPHGTLGNVADTGVSFNAGLEYILKPNFSVEGILGVHHFPGKIAGDTTAIQFTGGGKFYFMPGPNRPFVRAGLGGYHFTSGTTNFGGYFGGGWLHEFNAHFGVDGVYTFHAVNTPGTAAKFSTIQGGVRYAF
ncbi:MAG TPA: hypothetical protein VNZ47_13050 [Candidatus Dormibacteraeota bacterium]|jgi:hypothetical protein|nr:hypothetical protein [Candidatus Dormibacteraeota bacterium]